MTSSLTPEQIAEFREAFALFDKNGDGTIEANELYEVMKSINLSATKEEIDDMIREVDTDGDGNISFDEFVVMMQKGGDEDAELREAFNVFDKDKNGFIDRDEIKDVLKTLTGVEHSETEIDLMIKEADTNNDGKVSFQEFKKMMGK
jgi:calmodulin